MRLDVKLVLACVAMAVLLSGYAISLGTVTEAVPSSVPAVETVPELRQKVSKIYDTRSLELLHGTGPVQAGPIPGLAAAIRYRAVALAPDLGARLRAMEAEDLLHFTPFDDRSWACRIVSIRRRDNGVWISAVPETEPHSVVSLELRDAEVLMRLDRYGRSQRYALGTHVEHGWVAVEIDRDAERASIPPPVSDEEYDDNYRDDEVLRRHGPSDHHHEAERDVATRLGGPDFQVTDLPASHFRDQLLALPAPVRERAERFLQAHPIPAVDLSELRVSDAGGIYYHCNMIPPPAEATAEPAEQTDASISFASSSVVPAWHSRPGQQTHVLHLDFDGGELPSNLAWGSGYGGKIARPFDSDSNPSLFSDQELFDIQAIWEITAESFAAFDIDITTEAVADDTGSTGICLITPGTTSDGTALPHANAGGVAYVNVYGTSYYDLDASTSYNIAWVKPYHGRELMYCALTCAHEFGHNLGLHHDGIDDKEYYAGHDSDAGRWGPIMGGGSQLRIMHWCQGEYTGASNTEDDLQLISARLPRLADDVGDDASTARVLNDSGSRLTVDGLIASSSDTDVFSFFCGVGNMSATASVNLDSTASTGSYDYDTPSLDLAMELRDIDGAVLASADSSTSMSASLDTTLSESGHYYLHLTAVGHGDPMASTPHGFTAYGSLGRYSLIIDRVTQSGPEITIMADPEAVSIDDDDTTPSGSDGTDFGSTAVATAIEQDFIIRNDGASTLSLGSDAISINDDTATFSVIAQPSPQLAAGAHTTFSVRYVSSTVGQHQASISIANDDADEAPFDFVIGARTEASLTWTGSGFIEAATNDGRISTSDQIVATLRGNTFTGSNDDDFINDGKLLAENLPEGLHPVAIRTSDTELVITLAGTAMQHDAVDSRSDLRFTLQDSALHGGAARRHDAHALSGASLTFLSCNEPPVNLAAPEVLGEVVVGNLLLVDPGTWSDADGDTISYSYEWQITDDSALGPSLGLDATQATYTPTSAEQGRFIRCQVTASDHESSTSAASAWQEVAAADPRVTDGSLTLSGTVSANVVSLQIAGQNTTIGDDGRWQWTVPMPNVPTDYQLQTIDDTGTSSSYTLHVGPESSVPGTSN